MTRKQYVALAKALAATRPQAEDFASYAFFTAALHQWRVTRGAIADALVGTNDLFDRERFVAATEA